MLIRPRVLSHSLFACCKWSKKYSRLPSIPYTTVENANVVVITRRRCIHATFLPMLCRQIDHQLNADFGECFWVTDASLKTQASPYSKVVYATQDDRVYPPEAKDSNHPLSHELYFSLLYLPPT